MSTKSINSSSNKASKSASSESISSNEKKDFPVENSELQEGIPDGCSISGYQNFAKAAEISYEVIPNLQIVEAEISNNDNGSALSNSDGLEISLFKSLTLEGEPLENSGDRRDTNEQNTLDKNFPTSVKANDDAAEEARKVGKEMREPELKHENRNLQTSSVFSELMNQFQRHAVKKVSNERDKPAEAKLSRTGQISSYTSTTLINEMPDLNTEVHSMPITSTNSLSTESCNNLDLPNTKNDNELSRNMRLESTDNQEIPINQSPSNVSENNLNVPNEDELERKLDSNHQNLMNQPSPNDFESHLNAEPNDPEDIKENEFETL
nr:putative vacuolar protein sorting-associated protein 13E [Parasteatoda tepidariorum]